MDIENYSQIITLYFKVKRIQNINGYSYSWYKNEIINIIKKNDDKLIRNIFNYLVKKKIVHKLKVNKSLFYIFNPFTNNINKEDVIIKKNKKLDHILITFD